ncbi:MAG: 2-phospho-L-lactate guanylyltransferase [Chloroflexi bacterium]|nr:2-phospho-L-lactate guanylyltransferase [Chloroflexota bacterium]
MTGLSIVAVVPMKPLNLSKTRLASVLSEQERADLSLAMFSKVVSAAHEALGVVWVVGGDEAVKQASNGLGAKWLEDPGNDLNESLSFAFSKACRVGSAAIYLPSDLPFVTAADIEKIVQASVGGETLALSPAQQDGGTNAMLIPKCLRFPPLLGKDSYARHKQHAASLGIPYTVCLSEGLALDLDTPDDLALCDRLQPGFLSTMMPADVSSTPKGDKKD